MVHSTFLPAGQKKVLCMLFFLLKWSFALLFYVWGSPILQHPATLCNTLQSVDARLLRVLFCARWCGNSTPNHNYNFRVNLPPRITSYAPSTLDSSSSSSMSVLFDAG